jgi:MFS family permease
MQREMHWYEHIGLNIYWLGLNITSSIITPLLLPFLVVMFMPVEQKNTYLAIVRSTGLAMAMLVQPLAGMLSDRSGSRWGRRRPFILGGTLGNSLFLLIIGLSPLFLGSTLDAAFAPLGITAAYAVLMLGIVLLQISSNFSQAAVQGLIPDLVPEEQRGRSSGFKSVLELLPVFLVIGIGPLVDAGRIGLVVGIMIAGLLITMLITLVTAKERPARPATEPVERGAVLRIVALTVIFVGVTQAAVALVRWAGAAMQGSASIAAQVVVVGAAGLAAMAGAIFVGVYFGARVGIGPTASQHSSFIWWVINRLMFLAAVGSIQSFAQYFLRDVLQVERPASMTTLLLAAVALFLIPSSIIGGYLSDRAAKTGGSPQEARKRLVRLAGLIAAAGALLLIFSRSLPLVIASGCIIGTGTGIFMATNWALGTDLVPGKDAGRFLGISNLAGAGAGIVGAGIGGPMADSFNAVQPGLGYLVIFGIYCALFLLSTLALSKVGQRIRAD